MMASSDSKIAVAGGLARHIPVLGGRATELLAVRDGGVYIDATFGAGGYSREILSAANCSVIGIDPCRRISSWKSRSFICFESTTSRRSPRSCMAPRR